MYVYTHVAITIQVINISITSKFPCVPMCAHDCACGKNTYMRSTLITHFWLVPLYSLGIGSRTPMNTKIYDAHPLYKMAQYLYITYTHPWFSLQMWNPYTWRADYTQYLTVNYRHYVVLQQISGTYLPCIILYPLSSNSPFSLPTISW